MSEKKSYHLFVQPLKVNNRLWLILCRINYNKLIVFNCCIYNDRILIRKKIKYMYEVINIMWRRIET